MGLWDPVMGRPRYGQTPLWVRYGRDKLMRDITQIKQQIVDALVSLNPEKIILFGSYAYGTPTEDSDLDICVIEKDYENKLTETMKIRKLLSGIRISKDVLIQNLDEYNFYKNEINSVFYDIDTKGDVLWQKNY